MVQSLNSWYCRYVHSTCWRRHTLESKEGNLQPPIWACPLSRFISCPIWRCVARPNVIFAVYAEPIGFVEGQTYDVAKSESESVKMLSSAAKEAGVWLLGGVYFRL
jgi:hypothetical protein